jgi:hypothetical protein
MQPTTLSNRQQRDVHAQVEGLLARSPGFAQLPTAQRAQVVADTAAIVRSMAEAGGTANPDPYALPMARGQAVPYLSQLGGLNRFGPPSMSVNPSGASGLPTAPIGTQVSGGAKEMMQNNLGPAGSTIQVGVDQAARMVREIDFPSFVRSLIEGTFHAIVKASIEQMKAYAEMVRSVATSLDDFKDRNTTDNQAMDHLVSRYPSLLQVQVADGAPAVTTRDGADTDNLPDFQKDLGLSEPVTDLDDETIANKLVPAARDDLARGRQQLLATIVLMGINRIVVTDGRINAKIQFKFSAKERRNVKASAYDYAYMGNQVTSSHRVDGTSDGSTDASGQPAAPPPSDPTAQAAYYQYLAAQAASTASNRYATGQDETDVTPDVRVTSEFDSSQEGAIQASGSIMGEVSVNFKSDVFPLEKLVDTDQLQKLTAAQGAGRGAPPPPAPGATPSTAGASSSSGAPAATSPGAATAPPPPPPAPSPAPATAPAK